MGVRGPVHIEVDKASVDVVTEISAVRQTSAADCNPEGTLDSVHIRNRDQQCGQVGGIVRGQTTGGGVGEGRVNSRHGDNVRLAANVLASIAQSGSPVSDRPQLSAGAQGIGEGFPS